MTEPATEPIFSKVSGFYCKWKLEVTELVLESVLVKFQAMTMNGPKSVFIKVSGLYYE